MFGLPIVERAQEHRVDDAEHRGRRAHAEGEREESGSREDGRAHERAQRVAEVAEQSLEADARSRIAHLLLHALDTPHLRARGAARLLHRHAVLLQLTGAQFDVRAELLVELLLDPAAAEEIAQEAARA